MTTSWLPGVRRPVTGWWPDLDIELRGVESCERVGVPYIKAGGQSVMLLGVPSAERVGLLGLEYRQDVELLGVESAEQVGVPAVAPGPVTVELLGVESAEQVGLPEVERGPVTVRPLGVPSAERVGLLGLVYRQDVDLLGAESAEQVGVPTVTPGPVTVDLLGAESAEQVGVPTVTAGPVDVELLGVEAPTTVGMPGHEPAYHGAVAASPYRAVTVTDYVAGTTVLIYVMAAATSSPPVTMASTGDQPCELIVSYQPPTTAFTVAVFAYQSQVSQSQIVFTASSTASVNTWFTTADVYSDVAAVELLSTAAAVGQSVITDTVTVTDEVRVVNMIGALALGDTLTTYTGPADIRTDYSRAAAQRIMTGDIDSEHLDGGAFTVSASGTGPVYAASITLALRGVQVAAVGRPSVVPGAADVELLGVESGELVGLPTVAPGPVTVNLLGVESGETVGAPTVAPGPATVDLLGVPSAEAVGLPEVQSGASPTDVSIYYLNTIQKIYRYDEYLGTSTMVVDNATTYSVAVDSATGRIYWCDINAAEIVRWDNGTTTTLATDIVSPTIAVDHLDRLYWCDVDAAEIYQWDNGTTTTFLTGARVTSLGFDAAGRMYGATSDPVTITRWDSGTPTTLISTGMGANYVTLPVTQS